MKKTEVVAALREERATLIEKRCRLDADIERVDAALAAFGASRNGRKSPEPTGIPCRARVSRKEMAEKVYAALTPHKVQSAPELAEIIGTGESQVYSAVKILTADGRAVQSRQPQAGGGSRRAWSRAEVRIGVTT